jgi:hypothetical protein
MWPDINGFLAMLYGAGGVDLSALTVWQFGNAAGLVCQGNPPYTATDFLGWFPKFFGPATAINAVGLLVEGENTFIAPVEVTGLAAGQLLVNVASLPKDTVIVSVDDANNVVMSNAATADGTAVTVYEAPFVPLVALLQFVLMAAASVMQQNYGTSWPFAMALFIAHFSTMYMRSESGKNTTAAQVVASGLERGLLVGKSAGDVSASIQFLQGFEEWGVFQETTYGQQFATIGKIVHAGPVWVR